MAQTEKNRKKISNDKYNKPPISLHSQQLGDL